MKKVKANKTIARSLRIRQDEEIITVTRLRLADNMPVALETLKIAGHVAPGLTPLDVESSLYDALVTKFGIRIMHAKASISAKNPTDRERELLQLDSDTACLLIKMLDLDQNGTPVMTAECIYRSDLFELNIDVSANVNAITSRRVS
jgi:GntR family transcriptional regulator